jgi:ABC-2 type transport system permease protein
MNTEVAGAAAAAAPKSAATPTVISPARTLQTLVRREFWEHPALWRAPLIAGALLVGVLLIAIFSRHHGHVVIVDGQSRALSDIFNPDTPTKVAAHSLLQGVVWLALSLMAMVVACFYLLDCLYAERKDRSILFWKSLPVSDGLTVTSKLAVALIAVPLIVFGMAIGLELLCTAIWQLWSFTGAAPSVFSWDTLAWLRTEAVIFLVMLLALLWYAPIAALFLVVSAWARRAPVLWVLLPLIFLEVAEAIFSGIVGTPRYLNHFVNYRVFGIWGHAGFAHVNLFGHGETIHPIASWLGELDFAAAFTNVDLWLGIIAAGALTYAAVRLRRFRDET